MQELSWQAPSGLMVAVIANVRYICSTEIISTHKLQCSLQALHTDISVKCCRWLGWQWPWLIRWRQRANQRTSDDRATNDVQENYRICTFQKSPWSWAVEYVHPWLHRSTCVWRHRYKIVTLLQLVILHRHADTHWSSGNIIIARSSQSHFCFSCLSFVC